MQHYDIIGDVHGNAAELKTLLQKMGYRESNGFWCHHHRKAIFVGDFTCRGPATRQCISIVRNMTENGSAFAILGNHELNVIGHFTKNKEGSPFKQATGSNKKLMDRIKKEYIYEKSELKKDVKWLRHLPFSLDFQNLRVVHAYWSDTNIELIKKALAEKGKLTKKLLADFFSYDTAFSEAVRQTTRGIELNLPHDLIIKDDQNVRRTNFRIRWWEKPEGKTFRQLSYGNKFLLPGYTVPPEILFPFEVYPPNAPIAFVGHYCISSNQMMAAPNVCCIDNCAANGGQLAAYRWSGEKELDPEHFVFQEKLV